MAPARSRLSVVKKKMCFVPNACDGHDSQPLAEHHVTFDMVGLDASLAESVPAPPAGPLPPPMCSHSMSTLQSEDGGEVGGSLYMSRTESLVDWTLQHPRDIRG